MDKNEVDLWYSANTLNVDASSSLTHFHKLIFLQGRQLELMIEDSRIRENIVSIQGKLTPHLEVIPMNLKNAKELIKRDPNLFIADNMVDLVEKLEIENQ